jgi:hypothetical protein
LTPDAVTAATPAPDLADMQPKAPPEPRPAPAVSDAIEAGKLIFEVRPRYEGVDQVKLAARADAFTIRTHLGWETGRWNGPDGLIEFLNVSDLGPVRYNTTINGLAKYPVIGDPDVTEVSRLQLS